MKLAFLQDDISNTYAEDITKTEQDNDDSNIISELKKLIDKKSDREIQPLVWPGGARARASKTNNIQTKEICKVITNEKTRDLFNIKSIYPGSNFYGEWGGGEVASIMPGLGETAPSALKKSTALHYRVHGPFDSEQRAIVVVNDSPDELSYIWEFTHTKVNRAMLYSPFEKPQSIKAGEALNIKGDGLHIIVETK